MNIDYVLCNICPIHCSYYYNKLRHQNRSLDCCFRHHHLSLAYCGLPQPDGVGVEVVVAKAIETGIILSIMDIKKMTFMYFFKMEGLGNPFSIFSI